MLHKRLLLMSFLTIFVAIGIFDLGNVRSKVLATTGWAISGDDVYFTDGKVGIGTSEPESKLNVAHQPSGGSLTNPLLKSESYDGDGEFTKLGVARAVDVQGNYAYVLSDTEDSMTVIDFTDPTDPQERSVIYDGDGEFSRLDKPMDIDVEGNYAYIISYDDNSLTIVNISNPDNPQLESEVYDGDGEFTKLPALKSKP